MLARFDHPALVKVYRFWEDNGTAYMVMPDLEGPSLETELASAGEVQQEADVRLWLRPILDALSTMHAVGSYHHHIDPSNIILTPSGPVLLGFGAARRLLSSMAGGAEAALTPGYAPIEQYSEAAASAPGPWTDLYSLAAVVYRAITGRVPSPASARAINDRLVPLSQLAADRCDSSFIYAIDATLAVHPEQRPSSDTAFRELMGGLQTPAPTAAVAAARDLMSEPFTPSDGAQREVTVPIPTQPFPLPGSEVHRPMAQSFTTSAPQTSATAPVAADATEPSNDADEARISRKIMIAVGVGICVLGVVAAVVLRTYAGSSPTSAPIPAAPLPVIVPTPPASSPATAATAESAASPASATTAASAVVITPPVLPSDVPVEVPASAAVSSATSASAATPPEPPLADASAGRHIPIEQVPANDATRKR